MRSASSCFDIGIFPLLFDPASAEIPRSFPFRVAGPAIILLQSALEVSTSRFTSMQAPMRTFVYGMRRLSCSISTTNRKKIRNLDLLVVAGGGQQRQLTDCRFLSRNGVSQRRRLLLPFGIN